MVLMSVKDYFRIRTIDSRLDFIRMLFNQKLQRMKLIRSGLVVKMLVTSFLISFNVVLRRSFVVG
jgi:hypothetical protein